MWHAWERREKCKRFWWDSPKERDHFEDEGGKMGSGLKEIGMMMCIAFNWLRTGTGGGLL
jgi:hypothetical protein